METERRLTSMMTNFDHVDNDIEADDVDDTADDVDERSRNFDEWKLR